MASRLQNHSWPRLMKVKDAAAYIGTSTTNLRRLVDQGHLAQPLVRHGERLWDIRDLDEHAEGLLRVGETRDGDWVGQTL